MIKCPIKTCVLLGRMDVQNRDCDSSKVTDDLNCRYSSATTICQVNQGLGGKTQWGRLFCLEDLFMDNGEACY